MASNEPRQRPKFVGNDSDLTEYESGAVRDSKAGKPHYTRIFSPLAIQSYGDYMIRHSLLKDGSTRAPDNWKKGMNRSDYIDSMVGHAIKAWYAEEIPGWEGDPMEESLCAVMFNAQGRLHELLKNGGR